MKAYDILPVPTRFDPSNEEHAGWIFGLPRGIEAHHWPIDRNAGFPLMHGFTLRLPKDHRVHGQDLAGLSFFSVDPNHNDGGPVSGIDVRGLLEECDGAPPTDQELAEIWHHARREHPRLHRMQDILGCEYAVILLTEKELVGTRCEPPRWIHSEVLAGVPLPSWLERGQGNSSNLAHMAATLGGDPAAEKDFERAVRILAREDDPNAGMAPEECPDPEDSCAYTSPYDPDSHDPLPWAQTHAPNHIGGTMRPAQSIPAMSCHYIGFEEWFGDYNFGSGNAQLDFLNMRIHWAC